MATPYTSSYSLRYSIPSVQQQIDQADADLGAGITNITGVLDVSVVAGQAVGFTITTAPPVPITP